MSTISIYLRHSRAITVSHRPAWRPLQTASPQTGGGKLIKQPVAEDALGEGNHTADIALLRNYMASSFAASSDGHGGTLISEAAQGGSQPPLITQPHA